MENIYIITDLKFEEVSNPQAPEEEQRTIGEEILSTSKCGYPVEIVVLDNYVYYGIRAADSYPYEDPYTLEDPFDSEEIQDLLEELRAGVYTAIVCTDDQFNRIKDIQRTPGEYNDKYEFKRFKDGNNNRWRITLIRDHDTRISLNVLKSHNTHWYAKEFVFDAGKKWVVESEASHFAEEPEEVRYEFISDSIPVSEIIVVPADIKRYTSSVSYGDGTPDSEGAQYGTGRRYVPSGEVITAKIDDNIIKVSGSTPFNVGQNIRVEGIETVITEIRSSDIIVIDPPIPIIEHRIIEVLP